MINYHLYMDSSFFFTNHILPFYFYLFIKDTSYVTVVAKSCKKSYSSKLFHKELLIIYFKRANRRLIFTAMSVETLGHTFFMERPRANIG